MVYPGQPFLRAAFWALRLDVFNMAILVLLTGGNGYTFSVIFTLLLGGQQFFEASARLTMFMLPHHSLEICECAKITEGSSYVDEAMPTSESLPDSKKPVDAMNGSTINEYKPFGNSPRRLGRIRPSPRSPGPPHRVRQVAHPSGRC